MAHPLSNLQLEKLELFFHEVPDEDVRQIKRLITQYFAYKAIREAKPSVGQGKLGRTESG